MKVINPNNLPLINYKKLIPLQGNLKDLTRENYDKLLNSIKAHGFFIPAFVWVNEGKPYVLDAHQRLRVLLGEGIKFENTGYEIPYIEIEAKDELEARNKLLVISSQYGRTTYEGFDEFTAEMEAFEGFDFDSTLANINFDALPLLNERYSEDNEPEPNGDPDESPDVDEGGAALSVLGTVYQLGKHRLMCGDSTDFGDVSELINGKLPVLVFSDPPYGIEIITDKHQVGADFGIAAKGKYSPVIGDQSTEAAKKFYGVCKDIGLEKFIIWGGNYFTKFLPFSDGWLIWDKRGDSGIRNSFADGEMAWCSFHTPIRIYTQLWNGMIREGEKDKRVHPTQKPINMLSAILKDFTKEGDIVLDGFGGSGSILIAAHSLNRICYMMELSPRYSDVIRKRYHKLTTGKEDGWEQATKAVDSSSQ